MKLETIRNKPYYLKTGPSELAEFRLEYFDKFRDECGYVHVFKFKDINCRKIVVKPTFSVSLQYSMKMMLEVGIPADVAVSIYKQISSEDKS